MHYTLRRTHTCWFSEIPVVCPIGPAQVPSVVAKDGPIALVPGTRVRIRIQHGCRT